MHYSVPASTTSVINIKRSSFVSIKGRALIIEADNNAIVSASIVDSLFLNNVVHDVRGGAMDLHNVKQVTLINTHAQHNTALTGASLSVSNPANLTMVGCHFIDNHGMPSAHLPSSCSIFINFILVYR
jgi:hypothetical protein